MQTSKKVSPAAIAPPLIGTSHTTPASKNSFGKSLVTMGGSVEEAQKLLCAHIRDVPQIMVDKFLTHFMPPPPVDVCALVDKLSQKTRVKQRGKPFTQLPPLSLVHGAECWEAYRTEPVLRAKLSASVRPRDRAEKAIYSDLENIQAQIVACWREINNALVPTNDLKSNGTKRLPGVMYTSAEPDGIRVLVNQQPSWDSAAVTEEYELSDSDSLHNFQKIVWNMFQSFRSDARRRFVLGVTFGNTTVQLWHMNREVTVVSQPFDMNKGYRIFADVYARLAFATLSHLGYDHTIIKENRKQRDGNPSYRILIGADAYITTENLANYAVQIGSGPCTRVFRAHKANESPEQDIYAVKDTWVDVGRDLEVDIYNGIMHAIDDFEWDKKCSPPPKHVKELDEEEEYWERADPADPRYGEPGLDRKSFFIPIIAGTRVRTEDGSEDNTYNIISKGFQIPDDCATLRIICDKPASAPDVKRGRTATHVWTMSQHTGTVEAEQETAEPRAQKGCFKRKIGARVHHRTVMQCGTPMDRIKSVSLAFKILSDASYALFILHQLRLCHCDMSPYNILDHNGQGVLADFEYTKHSSSKVLQTWRTGTANFMAVEVMTGTHMSIHTLQNKRVAALKEDSDVSGVVPGVIATFMTSNLSGGSPYGFCVATPPKRTYAFLRISWRLTRSFTQPYSRVLSSPQSVRNTSRALASSRMRSTFFRLFGAASWAFPLKLIRNDLALFHMRKNPNQRLISTLWWEFHSCLCAAGQTLPGELLEFAFEGRRPLVEKQESDGSQASQAALPRS
ncbi:hypothetical protein BD626DRAFT_568509 [Schizophyllum amplum]|uniref:Protein kinase domain-containing protein n=1 Tax=Schizophyllum amplum TaxID=97359 RepID=A0A550CGS7_9AGAR|nr:hypothetical protein BD626DRAFT_568509 [Auriculariopsis ampla]